MSDANAVARDQLRAFIERIERLEEEKKSIADDIKDVYGEAKGTGFDTKVLRKLISIRKQDREERMEQEAILDMYMIALGMVDEPAGYDEPRQSEPVERQPAVALRSDAGLNIVTKHEDIRTSDGSPSVSSSLTTREAEESVVPHSPETAMQSLANGPCEAVSERTAFQVGADASAEAGVSGQPEMIPATSAESAGEGAANTALPAKPKFVLRPHCRNPGETCGGSGTNHCHSCLKAREEEAA